MKLVKSNYRNALKESVLSDSLMIKLEGESIEQFNPDAAINYWFDAAMRRPGGSRMKENLKEAKDVALLVGECSKEVSDEVVQDDDEVEIQDVDAAVNDANMEYELVDEAEVDSDYTSDYASNEEDMNGIFAKIAKY